MKCFQLSTIGRCEYAKTCALLVQLFEQTAQRYQEHISARMNNRSQQHSMEEMAILEGNFVLIIHGIDATKVLDIR